MRLRNATCRGGLAVFQTFGKLTKGEDVLKRIAAAQTVPGDIPFKRQGIERVDSL